MSGPPLHRAHSADVRIALLCGRMTLPIEQLAPEFVFLRELPAMPPGLGEILLRVDGRERRWPVRLPAGIDVAQRATPIQFFHQSLTP